MYCYMLAWLAVSNHDIQKMCSAVVYNYGYADIINFFSSMATDNSHTRLAGRFLDFDHDNFDNITKSLQITYFVPFFITRGSHTIIISLPKIEKVSPVECSSPGGFSQR